MRIIQTQGTRNSQGSYMVLFDEEKFGCIQQGPDQIREVVFGRTGLVEQKFLFRLHGLTFHVLTKNYQSQWIHQP